jgi:hypothetical protein
MPVGASSARLGLLVDGGSNTSPAGFAVDRLDLEQLLGERLEHVVVLDQDLERLVVASSISGPPRRSARRPRPGVVGGVAEVAAEERLRVLLAERDRAEPVAHPVLGDHLAGEPVALRMSLPAPVVMSPILISSATRPPSIIASGRSARRG